MSPADGNSTGGRSIHPSPYPTWSEHAMILPQARPAPGGEGPSFPHPGFFASRLCQTVAAIGQID